MDGGNYTCMAEHPSIESFNKRRTISITVLSGKNKQTKKSLRLAFRPTSRSISSVVTSLFFQKLFGAFFCVLKRNSVSHILPAKTTFSFLFSQQRAQRSSLWLHSRHQLKEKPRAVTVKPVKLYISEEVVKCRCLSHVSNTELIHNIGRFAIIKSIYVKNKPYVKSWPEVNWNQR